jgi:poly(3-hydroxybutyrate) depolymerase
MYHGFAFSLFMLFCLTVNAQTINLRGTVSNSAGKPITNAIVTLAKQGLKDTTGTDGAYSITKTTDIVLPLLIPGKEGIFLEEGILSFSIPNPSPVKITIFDIKGNCLKKESVRNVPTGFYRFTIAENSGAAKLLIIKASIGKHDMTFRYLPLHNGKYRVNRSEEIKTPVASGLALLAAVNDTLKTTATNYTTKIMAIASYDQTLNITLDTAGKGTKPSAGCGKAAAFKGETQVTVTAGSAGSRMYYIRLPDDYDQNHPYALWFTPHCLNGSAENVAHSEPDNRARYEYLGMWRCANPAGGKGTTIFCAPQGINSGWGQGSKDLEFFRYMINKFENELCIDMSRIFSSGFSMGGSMSYALACAMPDTMRAIAMHSGGAMSGCDGSHRGPVPIFITHGTDDGTCTWPGSGQTQINDLAKRDGCTTEDLAAKCKPTDRMHPVCVEYQNCNPGYPCRACIFKGEHIGSPGTQGTYGKNDTWVPDSTWSFFKRFY